MLILNSAIRTFRSAGTTEPDPTTQLQSSEVVAAVGGRNESSPSLPADRRTGIGSIITTQLSSSTHLSQPPPPLGETSGGSTPQPRSPILSLVSPISHPALQPPIELPFRQPTPAPPIELPFRQPITPPTEIRHGPTPAPPIHLPTLPLPTLPFRQPMPPIHMPSPPVGRRIGIGPVGPMPPAPPIELPFRQPMPPIHLPTLPLPTLPFRRPAPQPPIHLPIPTPPLPQPPGAGRGLHCLGPECRPIQWPPIHLPIPTPGGRNRIGPIGPPPVPIHRGPYNESEINYWRQIIENTVRSHMPAQRLAQPPAGPVMMGNVVTRTAGNVVTQAIRPPAVPVMMGNVVTRTAGNVVARVIRPPAVPVAVGNVVTRAELLSGERTINAGATLMATRGAPVGLAQNVANVTGRPVTVGNVFEQYRPLIRTEMANVGASHTVTRTVTRNEAVSVRGVTMEQNVQSPTLTHRLNLVYAPVITRTTGSPTTMVVRRTIGNIGTRSVSSVQGGVTISGPQGGVYIPAQQLLAAAAGG